MGQVTWRSSDELVQRVRRAAADQGRSMNDYVTAVLDAATDPGLAGSEAERLRERLARAGLLVTSERVGRRPPEDEVARARARARRGMPLSALVDRDR